MFRTSSCILYLLFLFSVKTDASDTILTNLYKSLCNCKPYPNETAKIEYFKAISTSGDTVIPILIEAYSKAGEQRITLLQYIMKIQCPLYDTTYKSCKRAQIPYDMEYYADQLIISGGEKAVPYLIRALKQENVTNYDHFLELLESTATNKFQPEISSLLSIKNLRNNIDNIKSIASILAKVGDSTTFVPILDSIISDDRIDLINRIQSAQTLSYYQNKESLKLVVIPFLDSIVDNAGIHQDFRIECAKILCDLKIKESLPSIVHLFCDYCNDNNNYFGDSTWWCSDEIPTMLWCFTGKDNGFIDKFVCKEKWGAKELVKEIKGDRAHCLKVCDFWRKIADGNNNKLNTEK